MGADRQNTGCIRPAGGRRGLRMRLAHAAAASRAAHALRSQAVPGCASASAAVWVRSEYGVAAQCVCHAVHLFTSPPRCATPPTAPATANSTLMSRLLSCTADAQPLPAASGQRPSSSWPAAHLLTRTPTNARQHAADACSDLKHTSAARSRMHDRSSRVCPAPPSEHVWEQQRVARAQTPSPAGLQSCALAFQRHSSRVGWTGVASACAPLAHGPWCRIDCRPRTVLAPTCSPQTEDSLFLLLPSARRRRGPQSMPPLALLLALCCMCLLVRAMQRACSDYAGHLAPFAFACAPSIALKPLPRPATLPPLLATYP
jgi:hypothetical protein